LCASWGAFYFTLLSVEFCSKTEYCGNPKLKKEGIMSKKLSPLFLVLFVAAFILGFVATSEAYEPQSPDEEAIMTALKDHENALNNYDVEGSLAIYHEEALIMTLDRRTHSKNEFADLLPDIFKNRPKYELKINKITVTGDQAMVKCYVTMETESMKPGVRMRKTEFFTYSMVRINNDWLILKSEF
jgi:ketosteroid isomerase-like protein